MSKMNDANMDVGKMSDEELVKKIDIMYKNKSFYTEMIELGNELRSRGYDVRYKTYTRKGRDENYVECVKEEEVDWY